MRDAPPDFAMVERASAGLSLRLPRVPHRGRLGDVRAASVGSSMELHDFRNYHPGDDLRHVDWNAVARTGELVVRVRQDEVSPRVEVVLDVSASMAVSEEKAARAKEVAAWVCELARHGGHEPVLLMAGREVQKVPGPQTRLALSQVAEIMVQGRLIGPVVALLGLIERPAIGEHQEQGFTIRRDDLTKIFVGYGKLRKLIRCARYWIFVPCLLETRLV